MRKGEKSVAEENHVIEEKQVTEERQVIDETQRTEENWTIGANQAADETLVAEVSADSRKEGKRYSRRDYILIPIVAAAAFIYVRGAEFLPGSWLPLFTVLFAAAGIFCLAHPKRRMGRNGNTCLAFLVIAALWFLVKYLPGQQDWELQDIMPYVVLFLHGSGIYWLLTISGSRLKGVLDESIFCDLLRGFFAIPLKYIAEIFFAAVSLCKRFRSGGREAGKKQCKAGQVLFGIAMSIPVLMIVLPILASADESFADFLNGFSRLGFNAVQSFFDTLLFDNFGSNFWVIAAACYFYGLFYGSFHEKEGKHRRGTRKAPDYKLPIAVMISFSAAVCGVYALFFLVKFSDILVKAFTMQQGYEYSEYARQGFFELCFISVINFGLFYFIKVFSGGKNKIVRIVLSLLCTETLGFIVLAFCKMCLYINGYGFTFKRIFTSWFMAVLFITFSRLFYCIWRQGNAMRSAVLFASITFLLLAYSNMDVWMQQANLAMGFLN